MKKWLLPGITMISTLFAAEPDITRFQSGEFELIPIHDTATTMRSSLFPGIAEPEFRKLAGAEAAPAAVNVFLLKRDGKIFLVDTGNGGERGDMLKHLEALGIAPENIDAVLLTHMHGDHIGGLIDRKGNAVFPRATVYVSAPELNYWRNEAGTRGGSARAIVNAYGDRVKTFRFDEEVLPGIRARDAVGHTPGHTVFETDSLLIIGDLLHAAAIQFPRPEICATYDMTPESAVSARRRFCDLAANTTKTVAGMHLPFPGIGRIERQGSGYRFLPAR